MTFIVSNFFKFFLTAVEAAMWATRTSDAQMGGRSRGCITTSYFTLLNYNTSMAFLDIIKAKISKMPPWYILSKLQRGVPTTGSINAIKQPGEVAVLADNRQITRVPISCNLGVADNIRSSLALCSQSHINLNRQFHFN